eukprot:gene742-10458_t
MMWSSWSRYSACSVTCGQGRQRRQRQCMITSPTSSGTCPGPKEMYAPCQMLACPEDKVLPCNCGCSLEENKGQILSQLPSKETKSCEWRILAPKGTTISLNVTRLILKAGWVRIASGKKTLLTLLKPGPEPPYPWKYKSEGNLMTLELLSYPDASGNVDSNTYLAAKYKHIRANSNQPGNGGKDDNSAVSNKPNSLEGHSDKEPNVPAIIGITACVIVIILVAVFLAVRRHHRKNSSDSDATNEAVNLSTEFDYKGQQNANGIKEEKPLMDGKGSPQLPRADRCAMPQSQLVMRPNVTQGRDSSSDTVNYPIPNQYNGQRRMNYPPDLYMKPPPLNYMPDPNMVRMVPVTSTGLILQSPPQQQYMMHVPPPPRSDHS